MVTISNAADRLSRCHQVEQVRAVHHLRTIGNTFAHSCGRNRWNLRSCIRGTEISTTPWWTKWIPRHRIFRAWNKCMLEYSEWRRKFGTKIDDYGVSPTSWLGLSLSGLSICYLIVWFYFLHNKNSLQISACEPIYRASDRQDRDTEHFTHNASWYRLYIFASCFSWFN